MTYLGKLHPDLYPPYDTVPQEAAEGIREALLKLGWEDDSQHSTLTAWRLAYYAQYLHNPPEAPRVTSFANEDPYIDHMVVVPNIPFWSACSHHLLPFFGTISVGYIPEKLLIGLSKIPLVVRWIARRPTLQEHLAENIANFIEEQISPLGVGVHIRATHTCQLLDLGQPPIPEMVVTIVRGAMLEKPAAREEFLHSVCGGGQ